ncbi:MAG: efflux RND transporter permease subunit, partial [Planctomycetota bacterium]|nr:efflux RND transporter permease subunit [Planctomycetota bacterium]
MVDFFINRPIVAIVIAILMVIVGLISMVALPVSQFPNLAPPEVQVQTTFVGADALTVEQSVATPIEQQMSGVDNMNYMYSINANNGTIRLIVNFDVKTDPNIDLILAQMRESQAESQLPADVRNYGVVVRKSTLTPLVLFCLYSPNGAYDATWLANYAYINMVDQFTRVPGVGTVQVFGAGQYAMRFWVNPDSLAKLQITVPEILAAIQTQNAVNPAGQIGGEPAPPGQEFTYTVRAQGRLATPGEFGDIVVRANPDGSVVRLRDVARVDLGAQVYNIKGRLDGKPSAIIAVYQLPGTNALDAVAGARNLMEEMKQRFPPGLDYAVSLDTTKAVSEGLKEILLTLAEALALVIVVVFVFLQGWRATLIPLLAVPVSLIGTLAVFPLLGFSINTLSLFGLVLAIGLVVDDAIVVVEAVERKIEDGLAPKEAAHRAMAEVSSPIIAIALILAAVFVPTVFLPGITGRLYQQFALTIAVSVILSAFNALSLSPALAALLLKPKHEARGPMAWFYRGFNRAFRRSTDGYVSLSRMLIRRVGVSFLLLVAIGAAAGWFGHVLPSGFMPEEDQGYMFVNVQLPDASSLQRTDAVCRQVEKILAETPGIDHYTTVMGISLLSLVQSTNNAFFFVTLKGWHERERPEEQFGAIQAHINQAVGQLPGAISFCFSPPSIQGVGTSGGVTFVLQDRSGRDPAYLADNVQKYLEAVRKRPELARVGTTMLPS